MAQWLYPRVLQSLGLIVTAYLFVCAMNAAVTQTPFTLTLPELNLPDGNSTQDLLLFSVPGQALFIGLGFVSRCRRWVMAHFMVSAVLTAWLQCMLFAEHFGNTWSTTERLALLAANLPWLLPALLPGLAWTMALERMRRQRR